MSLKKILAMEDGTTPALVQAGRGMFYLLATIWVAIGVLSLVRWLNEQGSQGPAGFLLAALMFGNAALMLWLGWGIGQCKRLPYIVGIVCLIFNIILTITDEFGIYDVIVLVITAGLLVLLVAGRKYYR